MKGTIVGLVGTAIACAIGIGYTEWRNTDPNISGAWINVSADMVTLGLVMIGGAALSILLILASSPLWPAVRQRLKTRRQRFKELAPDLRELQQMTLVRGVVPTRRTTPSIEHRTRTLLILGKLNALGIDCSPAINIESRLQVWRTLEECFEALAVLADAGRLDAAKGAADAFRGEISDYIEEGSGT